MNPDLLGYLLHSLDPLDERAVEEYLETHPDARRQLTRLRRQLIPLDAWKVDDAPDHLFFNTLRNVAAIKAHQPHPPAKSSLRTPSVPMLEPWQPSEEAIRGSWRRADVWVSVALVLVVLLALPPVLHYVRARAGQVDCRDNLRRYHLSFGEYAKLHHGYMPSLSEKGNLAHAGVYATHLRESGVWGNEMKLVCSEGGPAMPATLEEVKSHDPNDHAWWTKFGGSYGYNLGYLENAGDKVRVIAIRRTDGDSIPLLADRPARPGEAPQWMTANSPLHGGRGQNVLYNGGHVLFHTSRHAVLGDDTDIYSNLHGQQAAGLHPRDAVIGPSEARPVPSNHSPITD